jgi:glycogen operon protein
VGDGGYQVGNFPPGWSEWNGKYRDTVRDYWRGQGAQLGEFAYRFTGSSDLYAESGRKPHASINFVTAHDGFSLNDLVSYNQRHNEANGEDNRDGESHNRSWNSGFEGETDDPDVLALREKQKRNFIVTLLLSQGVPMLNAGDEISRTQRGNNNAYCQDNELSWFDWAHVDEELLEFTRGVVKLRKDHPIFRRRRWFQGLHLHGSDVKDLAWFKPDGFEMSEEDWQVGFAKSLAVFLNGRAIARPDFRGDPVTDDSFFVIFNAHHEAMEFTLPPEKFGARWWRVLDTATAESPELRRGRKKEGVEPGSTVNVQGRSILLLRSFD